MKIFTFSIKHFSVFILCTMFFALIGNKSMAQTITTLPLANTNFCSCDNVIISYSATGAYGAGNVFTVQLSDEFGNFVAPTAIGTLNTVALNGSIPCIIPCNAAYGASYRIRIVSSVPVATGANNGVDITIIPSPTATIAFSTANCVDTLTAMPTGGNLPNANGDKYYITTNAPWGSPNNVTEMNDVFGVGMWNQANFTVNPATVFAPTTQFVFLEGSDGNGSDLENFLLANLPTIENWVFAGGKLFLNAAPNIGGVQNWGFGGTILNYINLIPANANAVPGVNMTNLLHPINVGPYLPVDPNGVYTGPYFAHANVINGGIDVIHSSVNNADVVLSEKAWGAGIVMFGGMTTSNWHNTVAPLVNAEAVNMRKNILSYLGTGIVNGPVTYTYSWMPGGETTKQILPTVTAIYTVTVTTNTGCTATATYNYVVPPTPQVTINQTGVLCSGNSITLDAGAGFATYLWDDASINQTRVITAAGTYYVTVTTAQGCVGSDTIQIAPNTDVVADFDFELHLGCQNDTVFLVNKSTGATQWNWLFGDGGYSTFENPVPYVYFGQNANYVITLIVGNPPCFDTIQKSFSNVHFVKSKFTTVCNGGNSIDSTCFSNSPLPTFLFTPEDPDQVQWSHTWVWNDGTPNGTSWGPLTHVFTAPGSYNVTHIVTDTIGCVDSFSHIIFVGPPEFLILEASDSVICVGEKVTFKDSMSVFTVSFNYDFGDGSILNNTHNPTHTWDAPSTYTVTLNSKYNFCPDGKATKVIQVEGFPNINLGKDTSICPGVTGSILVSDMNNPGTIYDWSTGESAGSIVVTQPGIYWATSKGNCPTSDTINIKRDCYLNIPNAFSPDGDGINDYFLPRELLSSGLRSYKMEIYNRWGENVFTATSIDGRGWDGKYNGVTQPMGVFVYVIDAEFMNNIKKTFKGNVTLVR